MTALLAFARRQRATLFLGLLLLAGALLAQAAAKESSPAAAPTLSSRDAGPNGALALALWLQRLGYPVTRATGTQSSPAAATGVDLVLSPTNAFAAADVQRTLAWVRRGGELIYLPSPWPTVGATGLSLDDRLGTALGVALRTGATPAAGGQVATPIFPYFVAPPAKRFLLHDGMALTLDDDAWTPLVARGSGAAAYVVAAVRRMGQGRVVVVGSAAFFANASLGEADNAALVLNALARQPAGTPVAFDEYHHGEIAAPDVATAVRAAPWGWALIYATVVGFAFLLWGGRRFGPPVVRRRPVGHSGGDYVAAFAGLLQRQAGRRGAAAWAQREYAGQVRRRLARAYGVRADLPPTELARIVAERRAVDRAALAARLAALDGDQLGERALLARLRDLEPTLRAALDE